MLIASWTFSFSIKDHERADPEPSIHVEKLRGWNVWPQFRTVKEEVWLVDDEERSAARVEVPESLGKDLSSAREHSLRGPELYVGWYEDARLRSRARMVEASCNSHFSRIQVAKLLRIGPVGGHRAQEPKQVTIEEVKHTLAKILAEGFWELPGLSSELDDTSGSDIDSVSVGKRNEYLLLT